MRNCKHTNTKTGHYFGGDVEYCVDCMKILRPRIVSQEVIEFEAIKKRLEAQ